LAMLLDTVPSARWYDWTALEATLTKSVMCRSR
jgi:hypothetical protein